MWPLTWLYAWLNSYFDSFYVLPLILEKENYGGAILCFLLPFLQPTIGHDSSATAATTEQPPEQQAKIFGRPAENDFKIGTSRDKMKYKAIKSYC